MAFKALHENLKGWLGKSDLSFCCTENAYNYQFCFAFSSKHYTAISPKMLLTFSLYFSLPHFILSISVSHSLWISFCLSLALSLSAPLLKTVSALLLLHQKAVAKWRLTSAAATEEGLCVFSSWGQIPLKRAKLRSTISHCSENPNFNQQDRHFQ